MFPPPAQSRGGSKNKKHLSILAHSPNPVLHTSTSELSPLFSPAEFLDLLRRPADGSSRVPASSSPNHIAGNGPRLSPFGSSESSPLHFSPGPSLTEDNDGPFRVSLEVDAAGHASMLPLSLPGRIPFNVCAGSPASHGGEGQTSLLSPLYLGSFPGPARVANTATSPTTSPSAVLSPTSSSDSSLASQPTWHVRSGPPSIFLPPHDVPGTYHNIGYSPVYETQSDTASPVASAVPARRPPLVSHNSAPAVPIVQARPSTAVAPREKDAATLKPQRSASSLKLPSMGVIRPEPSPTSPGVEALASLLPIVSRKDLPGTNKKNHAAARSANYTPRPPNSWILYRSETIKQIKLAKERGEQMPIAEAVKNHPDIASNDGSMPMADVSKMVAVMWKLEGKEVKLKYEQLSAIRKLEHAEMYPDYKFKPTRKTPAVPSAPKPPAKPKPPRKAPPPLIQYPKTTPRPAPPPKSTEMRKSTEMKASLSTQSATAGDGKTTGKKKTLKRTKKSRSTLSSRGPSPEKIFDAGKHSPSGCPYPAPTASPSSWPAGVSPHSIPSWTVPGLADGLYHAHAPSQPLITPTEYAHPYPAYGTAPSHHSWTPTGTPTTVYYPAYPSTPIEAMSVTPQDQYPHPVPFNAFAADMTDYDYPSPGGQPVSCEAPLAYRSQLSLGRPPPAPRASFDGVAYTQIISDAYVDPAYHGAESIEVAGRPAEVFAGPTAESSLAATWSLLEEDDASEPAQDEASAHGSSGTSWTSSSGEWVIDAPFQQQWPAQGR